MELKYKIFIILIFYHQFFIININGFGYVGHEITASIAQKLLSPQAISGVKALLPKHYNGNMSYIAAWADKIKYLAKYRFTSKMHYFNPNDNPPEYCANNFTTSPNQYNLLNAIHNYTNRLDKNYNDNNKSEALKFFVHFIGELHQPLHLSSKLKGGNNLSVKFEGHRTNLHSIWDTRIIYKRIRELHGDPFSLFIKTWEEPDNPFDEEYHNTNLKLFGTDFYDPYVDHIIKLMKTDWKKEVKNWVICKNDSELNYSGVKPDVNFDLDENKFSNNNNNNGVNFNQFHFNNDNKDQESELNYLIQSSNNDNVACPEYWAISLASLNCKFIWEDFDRGMDLSDGEYYKTIDELNIIEKLLAIAGVRMAAMLNTLFM